MQTFQLANKGIKIYMYITRKQAQMAIRAHFSIVSQGSYEYIATTPDVVNKYADTFNLNVCSQGCGYAERIAIDAAKPIINSYVKKTDEAREKRNRPY